MQSGAEMLNITQIKAGMILEKQQLIALKASCAEMMLFAT